MENGTNWSCSRWTVLYVLITTSSKLTNADLHFVLFRRRKIFIDSVLCMNFVKHKL